MLRYFLCRVGELPLHSARRFNLPDGDEIVLFHTGEGFFAAEAWCPHAGGLLQDGQVQQGILQCIWHGWKFRLSDGTCLTKSDKKLRVYELKIEGGKLFILPESPAATVD